jgi:flagellar assembly protein FliH
MLIKRHKTVELAEGNRKPESYSMNSDSSEQHAANPEWSSENFEQGLVSERRFDRTASERRRGWRRVEDRELISKAHEEATAIKENAHALGFQEGLNHAQEVIDELRQVIESQLTLREKALESITKDIAELAVEVAARIIKIEVSCDDSLVMSLVRDTIQKSSQGQRGKGGKRVLIKVNPDDVATVKQQLKEDAAKGEFQNAELVVMGEATVDAGSCILETDGGMIDASFTTQLEVLYRLFGIQHHAQAQSDAQNEQGEPA